MLFISGKYFFPRNNNSNVLLYGHAYLYICVCVSSISMCRVDPVVWSYQLVFVLDMNSTMATDIVWAVPFFIGSVPAPLARQL
jgi:hypothetical protein